MKFRTEIDPDAANFELHLGQTVALIGSCFSDHIGRMLGQHRFEVVPSSHGILFHPLAIAGALESTLDQRVIDGDELYFQDGKHLSLAHHSSFSGTEAEQVLNHIHAAQKLFLEGLQRSSVLVLTLGTSRGWVWKKTGVVVGNCHKIPAVHFDRVLTSHAEIVARFEPLFERIHTDFPLLNIVLTVSPVRHWREGASANQVSKSHLLIAADQLAAQFPFVHYFPAYELFMDDLRDYRFYERDMIHPSAEGIEYVWEKFQGWCMSENSVQALAQIARLARVGSHIPSAGGESLHQKSIRLAEEEIRRLIRLSQNEVK